MDTDTASESNSISLTDTHLGSDIVRFVRLCLLCLTIVALFEVFGRFVDVLPGGIQLRVGMRQFELSQITVVLVFGTLIGGLLFARKRIQKSQDSSDQSPVWQSVDSLLYVTLAIVFRIAITSSGLSMRDPRLTNFLPQVTFAPLFLLFSVLGLAALTFLRNQRASERLTWSWRSAAAMTFACFVWSLCVIRPALDFLTILWLSVIGFSLVLVFQRQINDLVCGLLGDATRRPEWMTQRQFGFAVTIMLIATTHGVVGFFHPMPAWKMFRKIDRWSYEAQDVDGNPIDFRAYVPPRAYTVAGHHSVFSISRWLAETQPERLPFQLQVRTCQWRDGVQQWSEDHFTVIRTGNRSGDFHVEILPSQ